MLWKGKEQTGLSQEEMKALMRVDGKRMHDAMKATENNINCGMLDIREYDLLDTKHFINQIMVLYKNGRFDVLPYGILGTLIKDYLGIRYPKIRYWTVLPPPGSKKNPVAARNQISRYSPHKDILEH